jgi:hypothetical protein
MRSILIAAFVFVALVAGSARAQPHDVGVGSETSRTLVVGQPVAFVPAALPATVVCDDLSIVRVDDAGSYLRLTGLQPGATDCSFGSLLAPGRRTVYRFVVVR